MNQLTSEIKSQHNQEKESYTTPELVVQEPLPDITAFTDESGGM